MRVAIALVACVAAFTLTGCFEGPKGDRAIRAIRETPGRLDLLDLLELPDLQAPRELRERTFRFSSIRRTAPARMLMRLL